MNPDHNWSGDNLFLNSRPNAIWELAAESLAIIPQMTVRRQVAREGTSDS